MLPLTSSSSTALLILQQADERSRSEPPRLDVVAPSAGASPSAGEPLVDDMFSVMSVDVNQMKINLMERLGDSLGLSLDSFENASDFGREVRRLVSQIRSGPDGDTTILRAEHELGLDRLGISLDALVDAIAEPEGRKAAELDEALLRDAGGETGEHVSGRPRIDEIGLYSF